MERESLHPVFKVGQKFGDPEAERSGEHRKYLNSKVPGAVLGRADVGAMDTAAIRKLFLRPLAFFPKFLNSLADRELK